MREFKNHIFSKRCTVSNSQERGDRTSLPCSSLQSKPHCKLVAKNVVKFPRVLVLSYQAIYLEQRVCHQKQQQNEPRSSKTDIFFVIRGE